MDSSKMNGPAIKEFMGSLNEEQKVIIKDSDKVYTLVTAGPGSGKTRTIIAKTIYLIVKLKVSPYKISIVTFTNKAATELVERLTQLLGSDIVKQIQVGTFHAIALKILKKYGKEINLGKFNSLSAYDSRKALTKAMKIVGIDTSKETINHYCSEISNLKNNLILPKSYNSLTPGFSQEIKNVYQEYQSTNWRKKCIDFDDMILYCFILLAKSKDIRDKLNIEYLIVDECQDCNKAQSSLAKIICAKHRLYLGDLDQSIYLWRGADPSQYLKFDGQTLHLNRNYRSSNNIVACASKLIQKNKLRVDMKLYTKNPDGDKISVMRTYNESLEASKISNEINHLITSGNVDANDIAILYRTNAQSREIENSFKNFSIPYKVIGGLSFYNRKEIQDIIAMLRLANNTQDDISAERVLKLIKGIGKTSIDKYLKIAEINQSCLMAEINKCNTSRIKSKISKMVTLFKQAKQCTKIVDMVDCLLNLDGYLDKLKNSTDPTSVSRIENIEEFKRSIYQFVDQNPGSTLQDFLDTITLSSSSDLETESGKVSLMTLHSSKGLEFKYVFIVGCVNVLLPHVNSKTPEQLEEERRLFYVGMTRAKEKLYLSYYLNKTTPNKIIRVSQSMFLEEMKIDKAVKEDYSG